VGKIGKGSKSAASLLLVMNADTFSLVKSLLIASWYLGFLAADVAPAAGQGSSTAGATGFFLLRLRGTKGL
jgi:hypothetical protein